MTMNIKKVIEVLGWLAAIVLFVYASHSVLAQSSIDASSATEVGAPAPTMHAPLTTEEQAEARAFALAFFNRLKEQDDFAPLAREFFVSDFAHRLRHGDDDDNLPLALLESRIRAEASDGQLLGYYIAANNLTLAVIMYCDHKQSEMNDDGSSSIGSAALEDMFPAGLVDLLKTNPLLRRSMLDDSDDEKSATARIESAEELRAATALFEQAASLLRTAAPSLSELHERERTRFQRTTETDDTIWTPRASLARASQDGDTPARAIDIRIQPLLLLKIELELVRADGQLKVQSMNVEIDGD